MRKVLLLAIGQLCLLFGLSAQNKIITGKVTGDGGAPLVNVSVFIKGTKTGTITKADGTFSISVPANAKALVFSSVNMLDREVAITDQNVVNVSLSQDEKSLSEVVITGYTRERRREFAGSVGQM